MVSYNLDVVVTLTSSYKNNEDYVLWIDAHERMWETLNGQNREVTGHEKRKYLNLFLN